jgi:hypothetical protein
MENLSDIVGSLFCFVQDILMKILAALASLLSLAAAPRVIGNSPALAADVIVFEDASRAVPRLEVMDLTPDFVMDIDRPHAPALPWQERPGLQPAVCIGDCLPVAAPKPASLAYPY